MANIKGTSGDVNSSIEDEARGLALRYLIHYVGDIHQPLHASARVNHQYPKGDRGGNSFKTPSHGGSYNLHSVYDSVFYEFTGFPSLPMNDDLWNQYGDFASTLLKNYPESKLANVSDLKYSDWADESFEISKTFVYTEINHMEK